MPDNYCLLVSFWGEGGVGGHRDSVSFYGAIIVSARKDLFVVIPIKGHLLYYFQSSQIHSFQFNAKGRETGSERQIIYRTSSGHLNKKHRDLWNPGVNVAILWLQGTRRTRLNIY